MVDRSGLQANGVICRAGVLIALDVHGIGETQMAL